MRKKTHEDFINELYLKRNDIIILGKYDGASKPIECKCRKCSHEWMSSPTNLLHGRGCPECAKIRPLRMTHEQFCKKVEGENPNIKILGRYTGILNHIETECLLCGNIWNPIANDLRGNKVCPKCGRKRGSDLQRRTHDEFLNEMANKHPTIRVIGKYNNSHEKVECECLVCGYRWGGMPTTLLNRGTGCRCCAGVLKKTHEQFVDEMKTKLPSIKIRGKYVNSESRIECECLTCGNIWNPVADVLSQGKGCRICGINKSAKSRTKTRDKFIEELSKITTTIRVIGGYVNSQTPIECECTICGNNWSATPAHLLDGEGCGVCRRSKGERILSAILSDYNINYKPQHTIDDCVYVNKLRFDSFDLDNNIAYEYHGEQHYRPVNFGGCSSEQAELQYKLTQARDNAKREYCKTHGIPLIEIPYWEKDNMRDFIIGKWEELDLKIA